MRGVNGNIKCSSFNELAVLVLARIKGCMRDVWVLVLKLLNPVMYQLANIYWE